MRSLFYPWTTHNWTFPTHRVLEEPQGVERRTKNQEKERRPTLAAEPSFNIWAPRFSCTPSILLQLTAVLKLQSCWCVYCTYSTMILLHDNYKNFSFRQLQKKTPLCYTALLIILLWAVEWSKLNLRSKWSSWCGMPRLSSLFNFTLHLQCFIASSPFWHVTRDCFCDI